MKNDLISTLTFKGIKAIPTKQFLSNLNVGLDWKIDTQSLLRNQILVPQKSLIYKDVHDNISAKFTNYIKQGASSNDQNLLNEELEENISTTFVSSPINIEEMREMLDNEFKKLIIIHNHDYDKVMNIYQEMYNLDYLDDIIKGVKQPYNVLKNKSTDIVFMEAKSFVTEKSRPTWVVPPPRSIDQELPRRFPRPPEIHLLFNKGNSYKKKIYPLKAIGNLLIANANKSLLHYL